MHAQKSPLLVYWFTISGEAFIRILTIVLKVGRITKNATLNESLSLSTIVLNSRDWSEIVWLPEISRFKINLAISFI